MTLGTQTATAASQRKLKHTSRRAQHRGACRFEEYISSFLLLSYTAHAHTRTHTQAHFGWLSGVELESGELISGTRVSRLIVDGGAADGSKFYGRQIQLQAAFTGQA